LPMPLGWLLQLAALVGLALLSLRARFFDMSGVAAGFAVAGGILFLGGWSAFLPLVAFVIVSSQLTKYKYDYKRRLGVDGGREALRSWRNVAANGSWVSMVCVAEWLTIRAHLEGPFFVAAFLGGLATAAGDTLATEIGLLSRVQPRLITDLARRVPPGTSGGVTPLGTVSIALGSGMVAAVAMLARAVFPEPGEFLYTLTAEQIALYALFGGFIGSIADSVIGALAQGEYRCVACGAVTERSTHCERPAVLIKGSGKLGNDLVNFLATGIGTLSTALLSLAAI